MNSYEFNYTTNLGKDAKDHPGAAKDGSAPGYCKASRVAATPPRDSKVTRLALLF